MDNRETALREHLASYGIQRFDSDQYWWWGGDVLGETLGAELEELREPLVQGNPTPAQLRRFYDFIANPRVAAVVHSMKADAILRSGVLIERHLPATGKILDLGCSIGYLTTFYARRAPGRTLLGWDWSSRTIAMARVLAKKQRLSNVAFEQHDVLEHSEAESFDVICSSQTVGMPELRYAALKNAAASLKSGGRLVCVEPLLNVAQAEPFVAVAAASGLAVQDHEFVLFRDLGEAGAYPAFVFEKDGYPVRIDLKASYADVLERLGR